MRHRLIRQTWSLAYAPARGPDPGPQAHERPFRRDLASRKQGRSAPRPRRSCVGLCARFAARLRAAMPRADAPAQTHPWNKDEAGAENKNDTEWMRGQTRARARVRSRVRKTESSRVHARKGPGSVVWTDAGWLRAHARAQPARYPSPATGDSPPQPWRVLRWSSATSAAVCYCSFLSSQKRLRKG